MHLLHAGNPTVVIQAILGHTDIRTTDIYARANLEMMREAEIVSSEVPTSSS